MTAPELADVWVPVPLRWRHVQALDTIIGKDGHLWSVRQVTHRAGGTLVDVARGHTFHAADVDPDDAVTVLMPATERDAMTLMRDQLGAALIERRTA